MEYSQELLFESKTARDNGLIKLKTQHSEEKVLNKVKILVFSLWNGIGRITRLQLADFYDVSVDAIDKNYQRHKDEFEIDGVQVLRGEDLSNARNVLSLPSKSSQETIFTPAAALRMGFILRDSEVAKAVRTFAIRFIQGIGEKLTQEIVLSALIKSYPVLSSFSEGQRVKISAPLAKYWDRMKFTLAKDYPDGGIPDFKSHEDIRKKIQFLSTYTDSFKFEAMKELRYELANETKGIYPPLTSQIFPFDLSDESGTAVIMFQFHNLIVDMPEVKRWLGIDYIQTAKEFLKVDRAYLFFVAPFGATSLAGAYIKNRLNSDYKGYVGVLTVQDLVSFLYNQAISSRQWGKAKGEISSEFKSLLSYPFPEIPEIADQLSLDFEV